MEEEALHLLKVKPSSLLTPAHTESVKVAFKLRPQDTRLKTEERREMICSLLRKPL